MEELRRQDCVYGRTDGRTDEPKTLVPFDLRRETLLSMAKGHNSGKKQSDVTLIYYDPLQVMGTITGRYHKNPLKTARGFAETRLIIEKLLKGHNSHKNQLRITSI